MGPSKYSKSNPYSNLANSNYQGSRSLQNLNLLSAHGDKKADKRNSLNDNNPSKRSFINEKYPRHLSLTESNSAKMSSPSAHKASHYFGKSPKRMLNTDLNLDFRFRSQPITVNEMSSIGLEVLTEEEDALEESFQECMITSGKPQIKTINNHDLGVPFKTEKFQITVSPPSPPCSIVPNSVQEPFQEPEHLTKYRNRFFEEFEIIRTDPT